MEQNLSTVLETNETTYSNANNNTKTNANIDTITNNISLLIKIILMILIIIAIIYYLSILFRPTDTDISIMQIKDFHSLPEDSLEVIAFGSSHTFRGFVPLEIYNNYGIGAYNYGCNWQRANTTLLFLTDALLTQSPKVVLIETYNINNILEDVAVMEYELYYTREITNTPQKMNYIKQVCGKDLKKYVSYFFPFATMHSNWGNLTKASFYKLYSTVDLRKNMGYISNNKNVCPITIPENVEQEPLSQKALDNLNQITRNL